MTQPPSFHVGPIPIFGRSILAPMDGLSDLPFRSLCRRHGSAMSYTAFVDAAAILADTRAARAALAFDPDERPVVFQIFDHDEGRLRDAALRLMAFEPDILDLNMGCPSRCVAGRGAGAGLLRDPAKVARILDRLSSSVPIPVTAKIRLGWDDSHRTYLDIARAIEDGGGKMIAVHGRTKAQGYSGRAEWEPIAELKARASIPVVGNGDVASAAEAEARRRQTGCDAVMIGRAAIGNPWIFRADGEPPGPEEVVRGIHHHLRRMLIHYGEGRGVVLFRKHLARYLAHLGPPPEVRRALLTAPSAAEVVERLQRMAPPPPAAPAPVRPAALIPAASPRL